MISVIIPYIDQLEELSMTIAHLRSNSVEYEYELILVDNASEKPLKIKGVNIKHIHNEKNLGVLEGIKQGFYAASGESTAMVFIHSDVLIHELRWHRRLRQTMKEHPEVGMLGFFGAIGTGSNGGRIGPMSNMQGKVWGGCDCHTVVALHHGALNPGFAYAGGIDGLSMIWRPEVLQYLIEETDAFADWRPPHHFIDRIWPLKVIDAGWKLGYLGVALDHLSGATANRSDIYRQSATEWFQEKGIEMVDPPDLATYKLAEKQFFDEFGPRLGVIVDNFGNYTWGFR